MHGLLKDKQEEGMLSTIRTALKYLTLGLLAGVLVAPRKGEDTRRLIAERAKDFIQEVGTADKAPSKV
jgi:hypothetical protein